MSLIQIIISLKRTINNGFLPSNTILNLKEMLYSRVHSKASKLNG